jgi:hypothetical protein
MWRVRCLLTRALAAMAVMLQLGCCCSQSSSCEDVNHAERLRHDPVMRWIVGGKAAHGCAASPSQMGRFETRWLIAEKNLLGLADLSGHWIDMVCARRPPRGVVLEGGRHEARVIWPELPYDCVRLPF